MEFSGAKIIYVPLSEMLQCAGEADVVFMSTALNLPFFFRQNVKDMPPASQVNQFVPQEYTNECNGNIGCKFNT
jgi:glutamyl-tRNA reductase